MQSQCLPATKQAEEVIEAENNKRKSQKSKYDTTPEQYFQHKYSTVESVLAVTDAEECLTRCQRGRDIIKRTLEQNLQEFYTNIQLCYKDQESGSGNQRIVNY